MFFNREMKEKCNDSVPVRGDDRVSRVEDEQAAAEIRMQPILERVNDARPVDRRGLLAPRMKPRSIRTRCRRDRATATKTLRPPKSA
jgi:hypothetical protein